ncbi:F0F1 ATP synthase subunit gamma [Ammoniphilus oxalaticus]|uniref:ATP synthase gamma chain n=1 Tax=Ammoniphilus oxalaticus TaxID=66863 RepID=A0A419SH10_9BACL|nr:ATP synthase F1 subunit gamma [Ammoniphilus oxalaticus]RKD23068.1 F0F1 ATP synthase subunit gamma [Ammoniphilus oxalaticus]
MAAGIREIRRKIRSVTNTRQITRAMEMVAAAKLRRAQERAQSSRPYSEKMQDVIHSIAKATTASHPMLETRPIKKTGYLVISADRGLAGGLTSNLMRKIVATIEERHQNHDEFVLFVAGKKGRDFLSKRGYPILDSVVDIPDSPNFADIQSIANQAVNLFAEEEIDELNLFYSEFQSALSQVPTEIRLLPLAEVEQDTAQESDSSGMVLEYEYEPSPEAVLEVLLPRYAETLIFSALLESKASFQGAQMTAMGSASENASELIDDLTLMFNRSRQAAITQEISEIVAGANA